jgi:hypothetical protein
MLGGCILSLDEFNSIDLTKPTNDCNSTLPPAFFCNNNGFVFNGIALNNNDGVCSV